MQVQATAHSVWKHFLPRHSPSEHALHAPFDVNSMPKNRLIEEIKALHPQCPLSFVSTTKKTEGGMNNGQHLSVFENSRTHRNTLNN